MKIGVFSPTYNRPDFSRLFALQMQNQILAPDIVCIHQNGTPDSYAWSVADIQTRFRLHWIHTPAKLSQDDWYSKPLEYLIAQDCTHFFWCDHDDLYDSTHISNGIQQLAGNSSAPYDYVVNAHCGLLLLKQPYEYTPLKAFKAHAPGGMSSSMCFTRAFAMELLQDIRHNQPHRTHRFTDQIVARVTRPKFRSRINTDPVATTTYVSHPTAYSSARWVADTGEALHRPLAQAMDARIPAGLSLLAHVSRIGDVRSRDCVSVCGGTRTAGAIEGFSLQATAGTEAAQLACRARLQDGSWTGWTACNTYVGTRGKHQSLTGFAVRMDAELARKYTLTLWGKFENEESLQAAGSPAECVAATPGQALQGMQLLFRKK